MGLNVEKSLHFLFISSDWKYRTDKHSIADAYIGIGSDRAGIGGTSNKIVIAETTEGTDYYD